MTADNSSSPHGSMEQRLLQLLNAVRDTHDASARTELNTLLRGHADARSTMARLMVDEQALISRLRDESIVALLEDAPPSQTPPRTIARLFAWRPLTAAAAGLVIGLFSASMVFGLGVARSLEKVFPLFLESFESEAAPVVTGMPQTFNRWSGDFSEIVEGYQGLQPKDGKKMARVLRSDFEGKTSPRPTRQGDLMRVVDVRPFLRESDGGEVVITLSALFNTASKSNAEHDDGVVTLWALGGHFPTEESLMKDALAHSVGMCRALDRDVSTWESASTRLLLPPGTEMVLLKVSFRSGLQSGESLSPLSNHVTFEGHFVDDVRASISIRKGASKRLSQTQP